MEILGLGFFFSLFLSFIGAALIIFLLSPLFRYVWKTDETLKELKKLNEGIKFIAAEVNSIKNQIEGNPKYTEIENPADKEE